MTVLYRNPCYSEGSYNEVDLYIVTANFAYITNPQHFLRTAGAVQIKKMVHLPVYPLPCPQDGGCGCK